MVFKLLLWCTQSASMKTSAGANHRAVRNNESTCYAPNFNVYGGQTFAPSYIHEASIKTSAGADHRAVRNNESTCYGPNLNIYGG